MIKLTLRGAVHLIKRGKSDSANVVSLVLLPLDLRGIMILLYFLGL